MEAGPELVTLFSLLSIAAGVILYYIIDLIYAVVRAVINRMVEVKWERREKHRGDFDSDFEYNVYKAHRYFSSLVNLANKKIDIKRELQIEAEVMRKAKEFHRKKEREQIMAKRKKRDCC